MLVTCMPSTQHNAWHGRGAGNTCWVDRRWLGRAQSGGGREGAHTLPWGVAVQRAHSLAGGGWRPSQARCARSLPTATAAPVHSLRRGAVPEGGGPGPRGVPVLRLEPVSDSVSEPRLVGVPTLSTSVALRLPGLGSVLPSGHGTPPPPSCTCPRVLRLVGSS